MMAVRDVVEVVRHAAGKLADCVHLLALGQLGFQRGVLGGVEGKHDGRSGAGAGALQAGDMNLAGGRGVTIEGRHHGLF